MNVAELARRLRITPNQLLDALPGFGFDIGRRAVKVDDRTAWSIIEQWPRLTAELRAKQSAATKAAEVAKVTEEKREVVLPAILTVRDFAARLGLPIAKVMTELMKNGILAAMNERIDYTTASIIAQDLGFIIKEELAKGIEGEVLSDVIRQRLDKEEEGSLVLRPPVVVVMGHVDHGKTTLLDALRQTNVASGEAGGITQHIGAYQTINKGRAITFIDTPGHEAFTTMRSRGARVADVAILIVAADDGAQPQTLEALRIIEAAKLPYAVAINKMDKPGADPERVKRELSEKGVIPEEWGGKTPFIPISAKARTGIDGLLDVILLLAELEKSRIMANPNARALGTVIESHIDTGEGPVATVLVQNGTLKRNDYLAIGQSLYGRVRAMKDWSGRAVPSAPPGMPVRILGFKVAPEMGDIVEVPESIKNLESKKVIPTYKEGTQKAAKPVEAGEGQTFVNVIVKTDVLGSLEAILASLEKLQTPEVAVKVVAKGLGNINETEILQASVSGAIVYGFNVTVPLKIANLAREKEVEIQSYKIIYGLLDDIKGRLQALLKPEIIRTEFGKLKILAVFRKEKHYAIIGGRVEDGKAVKGAKVTIAREGAEIGEGTITELQHAKQPVESVPGGTECGLKLTTKIEILEGDVLAMYKEEKKERKLQL